MTSISATRHGRGLRWGSAAWFVTFAISTPAAQQLPPQRAPAELRSPAPATELSLDAAIARAIQEGEEVRLAEADVAVADTRIAAARAGALPQLNASTAYVRTFQSAFSSGGLRFDLADADRFNPDPTLPLEQRVAYLEQNANKAVVTTLADLLSTSLSGVGLGSPHSYALNFAGAQPIYTGGRVRAAVRIARLTRDAAQSNYQETAADTELAVRTAYYRALLSQQLEEIAQAGVTQAESFLAQERLRLQAGYASDLDVLRAEVSLENLRPQLVGAQNTRDLSLLNLKRLVNLPMDRNIRLTTPLEIPTSAPAESAMSADALLAERPAVRAAERQVDIRQEGIRAARAAYKPSVSLQLAYGTQAFPPTIFGFGNASWLPTSSATLAMQLPILNFQRGADVGQAQVQLREAQLQAAQLKESVQVEYEQALAERERARATIAARQRTIDQAQRVYDLTVLRYQQGQATQLEVSNARLDLLQARTNLAQALSDFYVAAAGVTRALGRTSSPAPAIPQPRSGGDR